MPAMRHCTVLQATISKASISSRVEHIRTLLPAAVAQLVTDVHHQADFSQVQTILAAIEQKNTRFFPYHSDDKVQFLDGQELQQACAALSAAASLTWPDDARAHFKNIWISVCKVRAFAAHMAASLRLTGFDDLRPIQVQRARNSSEAATLVL